MLGFSWESGFDRETQQDIHFTLMNAVLRIFPQICLQFGLGQKAQFITRTEMLMTRLFCRPVPNIEGLLLQYAERIHVLWILKESAWKKGSFINNYYFCYPRIKYIVHPLAKYLTKHLQLKVELSYEFNLLT